jgi:hypothetical protein
MQLESYFDFLSKNDIRLKGTRIVAFGTGKVNVTILLPFCYTKKTTSPFAGGKLQTEVKI